MRHWQTPRQTCRQIPPVCRRFRQTLSGLLASHEFLGLPQVCRCLPVSADMLRQTVRIASAAVLPPLGGNGRRQMALGVVHYAQAEGGKQRVAPSRRLIALLLPVSWPDRASILEAADRIDAKHDGHASEMLLNAWAAWHRRGEVPSAGPLCDLTATELLNAANSGWTRGGRAFSVTQSRMTTT